MQALTSHASVSSAELVRQFGRWQDCATTQPVLVTHHGRDRVVLISADHYRQLVGASSAVDGTLPSVTSVNTPVEDVMEHVSQGFIAFRQDMTVRAINRAACCFLKIEREAVVGRLLDERLPGIAETPGYANLTRAAQSGNIVTLEMPSFTFDGRWLEFQTFPYQDGAACLFRDTTDELEARHHADARAATLAALAVHGAIGRARLSIRGTFVEVDDTFAGMAGFAAHGLIKARLPDILGTRSRAAAMEAIEAVLENGAALSLEVRVLTRSGDERDVRIGLAPWQSHGAPAGAVAIMTAR